MIDSKAENSAARHLHAQFDRMEGAYAPITIRAYRKGTNTFVDWCNERGRAPFPAPPALIAEFLQDEAERIGPATVGQRLAAVRKAHRLLGMADPTQDEEINLVLRRIRRTKGVRPRQAKGLTRPYLDRFLAAQPENPWGLRNRAMLSLGYDLLARRSELVALRTDDVEFRNDGTLRALIRRSKSDPFGNGRLGFGSKRSSKLVHEWLAWRGDAIAPLFCGIYQGRAINRALCDRMVTVVLEQAAAAAGVEPTEAAEFSAHSLRVGAAQDLLVAGHETAAIMRAGGWKSINVLARYLESAEHNVWA